MAARYTEDLIHEKFYGLNWVLSSFFNFKLFFYYTLPIITGTTPALLLLATLSNRGILSIIAFMSRLFYFVLFCQGPPFFLDFGIYANPSQLQMFIV